MDEPFRRLKSLLEAAGGPRYVVEYASEGQMPHKAPGVLEPLLSAIPAPGGPAAFRCWAGEHYVLVAAMLPPYRTRLEGVLGWSEAEGVTRIPWKDAPDVLDGLLSLP